MPLVANPGQAATNLVGEALAELARPLPHGFVADHDAARGQQLLHHAQPERKAEIQPHGIADDLGWKPMALVAGASGGRHSTRLSAPVSQRNPEGHVKLTVPAAVGRQKSANGITRRPTADSTTGSARSSIASCGLRQE